MNRAVQALDSLLGPVTFLSAQPHYLVFSELANNFGARAEYKWSEDRIYVYAGSTDWNNAVFARSFSVIAHECAHRYIHGIRGSHDVSGIVDEGFADFLASVVTGHPVIGAGLTGTLLPRDVSHAPSKPTYGTVDPHMEGWRLAGALYHTRLRWVDAPQISFLQLVRPLLDQHPTDGDDVLDRLLILDDDNSTLADGTLNDAALHYGFTVLHGFAWPAGVPLP